MVINPPSGDGLRPHFAQTWSNDSSALQPGKLMEMFGTRGVTGTVYDDHKKLLALEKDNVLWKRTVLDSLSEDHQKIRRLEAVVILLSIIVVLLFLMIMVLHI